MFIEILLYISFTFAFVAIHMYPLHQSLFLFFYGLTTLCWIFRAIKYFYTVRDFKNNILIQVPLSWRRKELVSFPGLCT